MKDVFDNVWANARNNARAYVYDKVFDNVWANVRNNVWANTDDNVVANVRDNVWDNVMYTICNKKYTDEQLEDSFNNLTYHDSL